MFLVEAVLDIVADIVFAAAGGLARTLRLPAASAGREREHAACEA